MPRRLTGTVVVCDVVAATTNIARFLAEPVGRLLITDDKSVVNAGLLYPHAVVIGESNTLPESYFAASNHPISINRLNISGRDILYMSNNGTRVIRAALASGAETVITAAYVNLSAVSRWLAGSSTGKITVIAAGEVSYPDHRNPEDWDCGGFLASPDRIQKTHWPEYFRDMEEKILAYYFHGFIREDLPFLLKNDIYDVVPVCRTTGQGVIAVTDAFTI